MTFFGPDGSHHQDDLILTKKDVSDFAFWRCSISDRPDRTYKQFSQWYAQENVPFSAYHFVYQTKPHTGTTSSGRSAKVQAETVAAAVVDRSIPIMLDWEYDSYFKDGRQIIVSSANFDEVLEVADAIRSQGFRVNRLYTGRWFWQLKGSPTISGHGFELVNSNYGNQQNEGKYLAKPRYTDMGGDNGRGWTQYGGLANQIWQYGSRIWYGNAFMDMNAIREVIDLTKSFKIWRPIPGDENMELDFQDIKNVWVPPGPEAAAKPENNIWFLSILEKAGSIASVQAEYNLPVTGIYDQATANAYATKLSMMKKNAGL